MTTHLKKLFLLLFLSSSITMMAQTSNIPNYIPTNGLVGWWPFTGNAIDSSGNTNNGSLTNVTLTNDRFGKLNAAFSFNGINSKIDVADAASLRCRKITISAWTKSNVSVFRQVVYKADMSANYEAYSLSTASSAVKINSNCAVGAGWKGASFTQLPVISNWEHLVITHDGDSLKIYKNGVLDATSVATGLIDSCIGGGVRIGFNHLRFFASTGDPFDGVIDDVAIWNRALSKSEIQTVYNSITSNTAGYVGINNLNPQRNLHVKDVLRLQPRDTEPSNPGKGDIYFDGTINKLRVYDGTVWQNCW